MERFFYQAWKESGLPLPPGAGPTLSRVRSTETKGQSSAWHADQQTNRGHKRKHADLPLEVSSDSAKVSVCDVGMQSWIVAASYKCMTLVMLLDCAPLCCVWLSVCACAMNAVLIFCLQDSKLQCLWPHFCPSSVLWMLPSLAFSHASCQTEDLFVQDESDEGGYDQAGASAANSVFPLTKGGSLPHQKRRKGVQMNPTSTGNDCGMT